jgi:diguanylate cyclase (GGDEF)-like protein
VRLLLGEPKISFILTSLVTIVLVPILVCLGASYTGNLENIRACLGAWFFLFIIAVLPLGRIIYHQAFGKELEEIRENLRKLRHGFGWEYMDVPNQENECGLNGLKRELNWLAHYIQYREASLGDRIASVRLEASEYRRRSLLDSLTGVYNRGAFESELEKRAEGSRLSEKSFYLLLLDLDEFKFLNDSQGHHEGEQVLQCMGETLLDCCRRDRDFPFRYGGDEFGLLLEGRMKKQAVDVAERIHLEFKNARGVAGPSVSIGGAAFDPEAAPNLAIRQVMLKADKALYEAKKTPGHSTVIYS